MSILCVGQMVADVVVRPVRAMPAPLDLVEDLQLVPGGCATNTACVLAKLGIETALSARIGQDALGSAILSEVAACGVGVAGVIRDAAVPTSAVIVMVAPDGERTFLYRKGGNERLAADDIPDSAFQRARIVHVGGAMKLACLDLPALLHRARAAGCTVALDTDWDPSGRWMDALRAPLALTDYLLTNEEEGRMLTGCPNPTDAGAALLELGPSAVVVKQGERGATLATEAGARRFPAFSVPVLDTTCAGDAFAAGFLYGVAKGWALDRCTVFGNAAGALCTTQISHRAIRDEADVEGVASGAA
jgi:sugar/nucleoside kinase (ribokinase family)